VSESEIQNSDLPAASKIERLLAQVALTEDDKAEHFPENKIRPTQFSEFPGQERARKNLQIYVQAAKMRGQALDHVLLHGPPGLGKTSLARIIAHELQVSFFQTSGPVLDKAGDLAGILAGLERNSVLFIDEIHRLPTVIEEILYSAMEDFEIDIVVGQGPTARSVKLPVPRFTLIGATTKMASLSSPLVSRFGIKERFEYYDDPSLCKIIQRTANIEGAKISPRGIEELAARSRGTPRIANRLLRRVYDFAEVQNATEISEVIVDYALTCMEIDRRGLEPLDRKILATIAHRYSGGPVGIETLSYTVGEERSTIEDVYEPYLVHRGFLVRGPRGRELTELAVQHLQETKILSTL